MDKGIFYLVCSVVIILAVVFSGIATLQKVQNLCVGKTAVEKIQVVVTPTIEPTATPSARFFKPVAPTMIVK